MYISEAAFYISVSNESLDPIISQDPNEEHKNNITEKP